MTTGRINQVSHLKLRVKRGFSAILYNGIVLVKVTGNSYRAKDANNQSCSALAQAIRNRLRNGINPHLLAEQL